MVQKIFSIDGMIVDVKPFFCEMWRSVPANKRIHCGVIILKVITCAYLVLKSVCNGIFLIMTHLSTIHVVELQVGLLQRQFCHGVLWRT